MLYNYLPITAGLNRLVFYKRHDLHLLKNRHNKESRVAGLSGHGSWRTQDQERDVLDGHGRLDEDGDDEEMIEEEGSEGESESPLISYVLLCECHSLKESILTSVCAVIDQLRARCCGYSALYVNCSSDSPAVQETVLCPLLPASLSSLSHEGGTHSNHSRHHQLPPSSS
jgi:hypothetical protein